MFGHCRWNVILPTKFVVVFFFFLFGVFGGVEGEGLDKGKVNEHSCLQS